MKRLASIFARLSHGMGCRPEKRAPRRGGRLALGGLALGMLASAGACTGSPEVSAQEATAGASTPSPAMKIIGGEAAPVCAWPSTVRVDGATQCTGTLIHPRVVTTAAHCVDGSGSRATISFGERGQPGGFSVTGECTAGARGQRGVSSGADWAYCVLPEDERLEQMPITPPLVGCEAEMFLQPGARGWIVGFGATQPPGGWGSAGYGKHEVEVEINQLERQGPATIDVGDAEVGACHGDSGGPIYVELADANGSYGYRVAGSVSGPGASRCDCTCSTSFVNIEQHVRAIEENEGIDATPCTADDGSWEPGPECDGMLADPRGGSGSWPVCDVARTTLPIASCGAPFQPEMDAGVDGGAPSEAGMDAMGDAAGNEDATTGSSSVPEAGMPGPDSGSGGDPLSTPSTGGTQPAPGGAADTDGDGFGAATSGIGATPPAMDQPGYSAGRCSAGAGAASPWPVIPWLLVPLLLGVRRRLLRGGAERFPYP